MAGGLIAVSSEVCDAAIGYLALGLATIPSCLPDAASASGCTAPWHAGRRDHKPGKAPMVKWAGFQGRLPTEAEWERWDREFHGRFNLGFVTGAVSGTLVLDLDSPAHAKGGDGPDGRVSVQQAGLVIPVAPTTVTPSDGLQVHFAYPSGVKRGCLRNFAGCLPGVDARGDGGFAILPPSATAKGRYHWADGMSLDDLNRPAGPEWLLAMFGAAPRGLNEAPDKPDNPSSSLRPLGAEGVGPPDDPPDDPATAVWERPCPEGQRNDSCARLAGRLAAWGLPADVATAILSAWSDARCMPPMDPEEVAATVRSIYRTHARHDSTLGIFPAAEADAAAVFDRLPPSVARRLAAEDPATRCGGAAQALRAGMKPGCLLACLLAMNGGDMADARRALRWALRAAEVKGRAG